MNQLLLTLVSLALQTLTSKDAQDRVLDLIEDLVENTDTKIDDVTLLPLIRAYRVAADVPDND